MQKSRKNAHLNFTIGTNEFCDYTIDTKFDIQIVSTEGLNIDVLVKANDYDGHFVAKIYGSVDAADTDATVLEKISESWIDNVQIYG